MSKLCKEHWRCRVEERWRKMGLCTGAGSTQALFGFMRIVQCGRTPPSLQLCSPLVANSIFFIRVAKLEMYDKLIPLLTQKIYTNVVASYISLSWHLYFCHTIGFGARIFLYQFLRGIINFYECSWQLYIMLLAPLLLSYNSTRSSNFFVLVPTSNHKFL